MRATLLRTTKRPSKYGRSFHYAFFKGEDGKSYRSCLYEDCGNFKRNGWAGLIGKQGVMLDGLRVIDKNIIDADSVPKIVEVA